MKVYFTLHNIDSLTDNSLGGTRMLCISKIGIHGDTKMAFMETQKWYSWRHKNGIHGDTKNGIHGDTKNGIHGDTKIKVRLSEHRQQH